MPWWTPEIGSRELPLVAEVLASHYINEGDVTERLERALAKRLGVRHGVAVTSGTAALSLALRALGVGVGDEVLVPDVTFIASANAVVLAGAKPVLVDVEEHGLGISVDAAQRAVTPKTRAIMPVHVSGRGADMARVMSFARDHQLVVVEDAAEGLLSRCHGQFLGTIGHAGCFSFSPNKTITTGQGGLVVTNDDAVEKNLRQLKDQGRPVRGTGGDDLHPALGFNFKLTNLQAAVGLAQLEYLDTRMARQRQVHRWYLEELRGVAQVRIYPFDVDAGECPQWTDASCERRDDLDRFLKENGCHCRKFWHPLHTQPPHFTSDDAFPTSTRVTSAALWLPSAFQASREDIDYVCERVKTFYRS